MTTKRLTLDNFINFFLFFYIISLYLLTYREGLNNISNMLALLTIVSIWINIALTSKKLTFNDILLIQTIFILVCLFSAFVAINPNTVVIKVRTLFLILILMISIVNYIDSYVKITKLIKYFIYSGFLASLYVLLNADFSVAKRYGSDLGNQNAIGMIIAISSIFCFYIIISDKKIFYSVFLLVMIPCILLTGSRKALLFLLMNIIIILYFKNRNSIMNKLKFIFLALLIVCIFSYMVFNIPIFYEIIGDRMENLFSFIGGKTINEGSVYIRANMTMVGFELFKKRPFLGYGIDNYRFLYSETYSHNNFVELMVGIGLLGALIFYLTHIIVIRRLYKFSGVSEYSLLCYMFIAIIISYIVVSPSLVYYDSKHFSILLAIASTICTIKSGNGQGKLQIT